METLIRSLIMFIILFIIVCIVILFLFVNHKNQEENSNRYIEEDIMVDEIFIKVNGRILNVKLEENRSSLAFVEKLKEGDITIQAHDYGNFEKVGNLGFSLPTSDEDITTEAGDLILYQGNQITLYYDTNRWEFTKLGRVQNTSQKELKEILGKGDVEFTFSLNS